MLHAKQALKRKQRTKVLPVLGAAGLSLSLASGAAAATGGTTDMPTLNTGVSQGITLTEEEFTDVSLSRFYLFDKENPSTFRRFAGRGGGGGEGTVATVNVGAIVADNCKPYCSRLFYP